MKRILTLLYPGIRVKRWLLLFGLGIMMIGAGFAIGVEAKFWGRIEDFLIDLIYTITGHFAGPFLTGMILIILGALCAAFALSKLIQAIMGSLLPHASGRLVEAMYYRRYLERGPRIVVLGGGTGLGTLLRGLKQHSSNLTAIVTVADDGGSSGRLRDELGILPPGDFRNCLVALADTEPLMEKLFQYRFPEGGALAGHSFGNLFIAAMTGVTGDFASAVRESSTVLAILGHVLPPTLENVTLHAEYEDGSVVAGESNIPLQGKPVKRVFLTPEHTEATPQALEAIRQADMIILGPGSLYTSVIPILLVGSIVDALQKAEAKKVYACNIMTQPGETDAYTAEQHLKALLDHSYPGLVDIIVVNNESVPAELADRYKEQNAYPVTFNRAALQSMGVQVIEAPMVSRVNLARHDPERLGGLMYRLAMTQKLSKANPLIALLARVAPRFLSRYYHTGK